MNLRYIKEVSFYQKKDAVIVFLFFICYLILITASGFANLLFGLSMLGSWLNLVAVAVCVVLILYRKERLSSIGFGRENLLGSLGIGLLCSVISIIVLAIVPLINNCAFAPVTHILSRFGYQLLFIAFAEEVLFRGYIQTRLYGMFKNEVSAILIGALLFAVMHLPVMLVLNGVAWLFSISTLFLFVFWFSMHIIFNFVYRRTGSIFGVVLFHAVFNSVSSIFIDLDTVLFGFDFSYVTHGVIPALLAIVFLVIEVKTSRSLRTNDNMLSAD